MKDDISIADSSVQPVVATTSSVDEPNLHWEFADGKYIGIISIATTSRMRVITLAMLLCYYSMQGRRQGCSSQAARFSADGKRSDWQNGKACVIGGGAVNFSSDKM